MNFQHTEDRRMLATAVDDYYAVHLNQIHVVGGYGAWSNDSYNESTDYTTWWWNENGDYVPQTEHMHASGSVTAGPAHGTPRPAPVCPIRSAPPPH